MAAAKLEPYHVLEVHLTCGEDLALVRVQVREPDLEVPFVLA